MTPTASFSQYYTVTPSDTVAFTQGKCRGLYVGGTGDVVAVMGDGNTATFKAVPVGTTLHIECIRVNATSTTATLMLALY